MFESYEKLYIQRTLGLTPGLNFTINHAKKGIGTIKQTKSSEINPGNELMNRVIKLASFFFSQRFFIEELVFDVCNETGQIIGKIYKGIGLNKDFILYSNSGEHVATIKSIVKINSPALKVTDTNGNLLFEARGAYGATDFTIHEETGKQVSSIKKRSLIYETAKEDLLNDDVYHIENLRSDDILTFVLIGMAVVININWHF